jgi:hypothetical protein
LIELEYSGDANLWPPGDASKRRVYLMPVSTPSQFLAFGVLVPEKTAVFVGRGRLREALGSFVARMVRDGARVELYAKPPLPRWLVNHYTKGPGHEGHEYEEPPDQDIPGMAPVEGTKASSTATVSARDTRTKTKKSKPKR